jgi:hypothetical protein
MFLVKMKYEGIDSIELAQIRLCVNLLSILFEDDSILGTSMSQEQPILNFLHEFLKACVQRKPECSRLETEISSENSSQIESGISRASSTSLKHEVTRQRNLPRKMLNSTKLLQTSPMPRDQTQATQRMFVNLLSEMDLLINRMHQALTNERESISVKSSPPS